MAVEELVVVSLVAVPLIGAIVVWALGPKRGPLIRSISVGCSVLMLVLAFFLAFRLMAVERVFDPPSDQLLQQGNVSTFVPEFVPGSTDKDPHRTTWDVIPLGNGAIQFFLGVDGLNIWLVVLTSVLMLPSVLISFWHIQERVNEFYGWLLALQTALFGVFLAFDIVLFYVFFELSLVPLFFLIGIFGGSERRYAARKFVIYTLAGSLFTMLGLIGIINVCAIESKQMTFSIPELITIVHQGLASPDPLVATHWQSTQYWVFFALALGLAVKVPLLPFHTWLPLAHVEAPTAGSVDLAGILLKIGSYGFLRLCIPLAPDAALQYGLPLLTWLAAIGVVYGALCALAQTDIKRLIAYSSISHVGIIMLGMFSFTTAGLQGSIIQMVNHGLSTGGLFLLIGMIYDRYHTRKIADYSGMAAKMPLFAVFMVFMALSSVGLPGLNGFIGEFLCLAGIAQYEVSEQQVFPILTVIGASGLILGAWYLMITLRRVLFGPLREPVHEGHTTTDLTPREWGLLTPIAILCVFLGVFPEPFLRTTEPDVKRIALVVERARLRAGVISNETESKSDQNDQPKKVAVNHNRLRPTKTSSPTNSPITPSKR